MGIFDRISHGASDMWHSAGAAASHAAHTVSEGASHAYDSASSALHSVAGHPAAAAAAPHAAASSSAAPAHSGTAPASHGATAPRSFLDRASSAVSGAGHRLWNGAVDAAHTVNTVQSHFLEDTVAGVSEGVHNLVGGHSYIAQGAHALDRTIARGVAGVDNWTAHHGDQSETSNVARDFLRGTAHTLGGVARAAVRAGEGVLDPVHTAAGLAQLGYTVGTHSVIGETAAGLGAGAADLMATGSLRSAVRGYRAGVDDMHRDNVRDYQQWGRGIANAYHRFDSGNAGDVADAVVAAGEAASMFAGGPHVPNVAGAAREASTVARVGGEASVAAGEASALSRAGGEASAATRVPLEPLHPVSGPLAEPRPVALEPLRPTSGPLAEPRPVALEPLRPTSGPLAEPRPRTTNGPLEMPAITEPIRAGEAPRPGWANPSEVGLPQYRGAPPGTAPQPRPARWADNGAGSSWHHADGTPAAPLSTNDAIDNYVRRIGELTPGSATIAERGGGTLVRGAPRGATPTMVAGAEEAALAGRPANGGTLVRGAPRGATPTMAAGAEEAALAGRPADGGTLVRGAPRGATPTMVAGAEEAALAGRPAVDGGTLVPRGSSARSPTLTPEGFSSPVHEGATLTGAQPHGSRTLVRGEPRPSTPRDTLVDPVRPEPSLVQPAPGPRPPEPPRIGPVPVETPRASGSIRAANGAAVELPASREAASLQMRSAAESGLGRERYQGWQDDLARRYGELPPELRESVTPAQFEAIHGYTAPSSGGLPGGYDPVNYQSINRALWTGDAAELDRLSGHIAHLDDGLAALPRYEGSVQRVQRLSPEQIARYREAAGGGVVTEAGYTSTGRNRGYDADFSPLGENQQRVRFEYSGTTSGRDINAMSRTPGEGGGEVLFPRDSRFVVESVAEAADGYTVVRMREPPVEAAAGAHVPAGGPATASASPPMVRPGPSAPPMIRPAAGPSAPPMIRPAGGPSAPPMIRPAGGSSTTPAR